LGSEIARHPAVSGAFPQQLDRMIDGMAGWFESRDEDASRQDALQLLSAAVGALILARSVDDPELSDEILASVRQRLDAT
jgi:TetR/AcrR family transcriptional repressor of nem operon